MSNKLPMFKDIYNQKIDFRFIAYSNIGKYVYECTYDDFMVYQSEAKLKEAGKLRLEGKDYVAKDGDIMHFRFHV